MRLPEPSTAFLFFVKAESVLGGGFGMKGIVDVSGPVVESLWRTVTLDESGRAESSSLSVARAC